MADNDGSPGRLIVFTWNALPIPGVRQKGIALNGNAIDVTSDENNGWRKLLTVSAQDQVDLTISGVTKSVGLKSDWFAGNRTRDVTLTYPDGSVLSGTFFLATFTDTGPYNDATTFSATLQSTDVVTFTPAP